MYFDDCLKLEETFLVLYKKFMEGDFCIQQSTRASSAVTINQAVKQSHNKTNKGKGDVIGINALKATVAKWNLIKHE